MKKQHHLLLFVCGIVLLCSFSQDSGYYGNYSQTTPLLMLRTDFEGAIKTLDPKELEQTSRISLKDDRIYIVELYKGIHVIDNADPSSPVTEYFLNIPGCVDMTIKGSELYARSAVDLVAIDISDISAITEINRVRETFSELTNGEYYGIPYRFTEGQRPENTVIVGWVTNDI